MEKDIVSTVNRTVELNKRDLMREKVLDAAALQMNFHGAASINLNSVSAAVDLTRNAFYHYFKSRQELIYHSYLRANYEFAKDLTQLTSLESDISLTDKIKTLITLNLAEGKPERTVLRDLGVLGPDEQEVIRDLNKQNILGVEAILTEGVRRGEFRSINIPIATQVILGMMDWARLWHVGIDQISNNTSDRQPISASSIIDILLRGVASQRHFQLINSPDLVSITARDFNAFDIQDISNEKRLQLVGTASRLFNQRGIEATSIEDVASALGATKGAVYHYFKNKKQLLEACYERAFELYEQLIDASEKSSSNPVNVMMTTLHLNCQAQASRYPPLIFKSNPLSLPDRFAQRAMDIRRRSQDTHIDAIEQGLCRSDSVIVDVSVGGFLWVQKWIGENQLMDARLLADEVCSIFSSGIATSDN